MDKRIKSFESKNQQMKPIFEKFLELDKIFPDSEIIKEIEYVKKLKEWINDNEFFSKMKKGFSAQKDGFNSENWHKAVDGKGKTLVIIKTKENFIFGGFTSVGWTNDKSKWREEDTKNKSGYIPDPNSFIFSLRNFTRYRISKKFPIKQEEKQYAIEYDLNHGPTFGSDIRLNSDLQSGYSNFGRSYNLPNRIQYDTKEAKNYLAGSYNKWIVYEVETYFV